MSRISIAMTAYNGAEFIEQQLNSLRDQTVPPAEIVICDDGSTDNTGEVVARFAATAPFPVRYEINPERLGFRANFIKSASLCRSEFIAFCDQDDVWTPEKLKTCIEHLSLPEVLLFHHDFSLVDKALNVTRAHAQRPLQSGAHDSNTIDPRFYPLGFSIAFNRKLLDYNKDWLESANLWHDGLPEGHDQWFYGIALGLGKIAYGAESLVLYRQHGKNTYGFTKASRVAKIRIYKDHLLTNVKCFGKREAFYKARSGDAGGYMRDNATRSAHLYDSMRRDAELRLLLTEKANPLSRLWLLSRLIYRGAYYKKDLGGAGLLGLLQDLTTTVLGYREAMPQKADGPS